MRNSKYNTRKRLRLNNYDYSKKGIYFITICSIKHQHIFGSVVSNNNVISFKKNKAGIYVEECINLIPENFNNTELHEYVIMPNHLHLLLEIKDNSNKSNISSIVRYFKIKVTQWFYQNVLPPCEALQ
jgi:REP element-mobilizing transposase RayT